MLDTPHDFVRTRQPLSLPSSASDLTQQRMAVFSEKSAANSHVLKNEVVANPSAVATTPSGSSSVTTFLQGLWASSDPSVSDAADIERAPHQGLPSSLISDVLAPLSFGAEPRSWPLQRLDRELVNAAFQLVPTEVPFSQVTNCGPDFNESRPASGSRNTTLKTLHSAVCRLFLCLLFRKFGSYNFSESE